MYNWLMGLHITEVNVCRSDAADSSGVDTSLSDWLGAVRPSIRKLREHLQQWHHQRGGHASELGISSLGRLATAQNIGTYGESFREQDYGGCFLRGLEHCERKCSLDHRSCCFENQRLCNYMVNVLPLQWSACTLWLARQTA